MIFLHNVTTVNNPVFEAELSSQGGYITSDPDMAKMTLSDTQQCVIYTYLTDRTLTMKTVLVFHYFSQSRAYNNTKKFMFHHFCYQTVTQRLHTQT